MSRTKTGFVRRRWHKKLLKKVKGQWGTRGRLHRRSNEALIKSLWYAYRDRRSRKRDMRRLWIVRVNAAARLNGTSYSKLMHGLKQANVNIDRKMLADVAVRDPATFTKLVALVAVQPTGQGGTPVAMALGSANVRAVGAAAPAAAATPAVKQAPKAAPAPKAEKAAAGDKLTRIEGLGPKSAEALHKAGITTFAQIAASTGEDLERIVKEEGGVNIVAGQTKSWPKQAQFLVDGDEAGFKEYTDRLVGGREPEE